MIKPGTGPREGAALAQAGGAYVVRDEEAGGPASAGKDSLDQGNLDQLYPYTLRGLTDALEDARFRSFAGPPQLVLVRGATGLKVIRRYVGGREVTGLPAPVRGDGNGRLAPSGAGRPSYCC